MKINKKLLSWCFISTETIKLMKDGEPRKATSTLTQLLGSKYKKTWCLMSTETIQLIRDGEMGEWNQEEMNSLSSHSDP